MKIAIQNVGRKVTADSLDAVFSTYGEVHAVALIDDANDGRRRAVVIMPDVDAASKAILRLNGHIVDGAALVLSHVPVKRKKRLHAFFKRFRYFLKRRNTFYRLKNKYEHR
jgi:hypothetical protein